MVTNLQIDASLLDRFCASVCVFVIVPYLSLSSESVLDRYRASQRAPPAIRLHKPAPPGEASWRGTLRAAPPQEQPPRWPPPGAPETKFKIRILLLYYY